MLVALSCSFVAHCGKQTVADWHDVAKALRHGRVCNLLLDRAMQHLLDRTMQHTGTISKVLSTHSLLSSVYTTLVQCRVETQSAAFLGGEMPGSVPVHGTSDVRSYKRQKVELEVNASSCKLALMAYASTSCPADTT